MPVAAPASTSQYAKAETAPGRAMSLFSAAASAPHDSGVTQGLEVAPAVALALGYPKTQRSRAYRRLSGSWRQRNAAFYFFTTGTRRRAVHRNQAWSPSPPCVYVLPCRHARQVLSLRPAASASASNCPSAQTMSPARVLDELGSEASRPAESMHADEQGELGVTWRAAADTASSSGSRRRRLLEAMMADGFFFGLWVMVEQRSRWDVLSTQPGALCS